MASDTYTDKKAVASLRACCANCGALEDPPDTVLSACSRCHLVFYCSRTCQAQHWKQKTAGHRQFCVTPEERRSDQRETTLTPGTPKPHDCVVPSSKDNECAICLKTLDPSSAGCCALPCFHVFHIPCAEGLRSFSTAQVCPISRAHLPPGRSSVLSKAVGFTCP